MVANLNNHDNDFRVFDCDLSLQSVGGGLCLYVRENGCESHCPSKSHFVKTCIVFTPKIGCAILKVYHGLLKVKFILLVKHSQITIC